MAVILTWLTSAMSTIGDKVISLASDTWIYYDTVETYGAAETVGM